MGGEQGREVGVDHPAQLDPQCHQVAMDRVGLALQPTQPTLDPVKPFVGRLKFFSDNLPDRLESLFVHLRSPIYSGEHDVAPFNIIQHRPTPLNNRVTPHLTNPR